MNVQKQDNKWPWKMFYWGAALMFIFLQFSLLTIDYKPSTELFPYRIGFMFVLGLPLSIIFSFAYSALFCFISYRIGKKVAFIAMIIVSLLLGISFVKSSLPSERFRKLFGNDISKKVKLEMLKIHDHPHGYTYTGKFIGTQKEADEVICYWSLKKKDSQTLGSFTYDFEGDQFPSNQIIYGDEHKEIYYNPNNGRIYFTLYGHDVHFIRKTI